MYSSYKRIISYFPNTDMEAKGKPGPDELKLLEPFRDKLAAVRLRRSLYAAGQRRLGQRPHAAQASLRPAARGRLQARRRRRCMLPSGKPLTIEFLDFERRLQPHTMPFIQNLASSASRPISRIVDPAQYKSRTEAFDFDVVIEALAASTTPASTLRVVFSSSGRRAERLAQSRRRRRSGRRRADRDDRRGEIARGAQQRLPRARPRAARRPLLGSDVVSRHGLGRLLGRLLPARAPAQARRRRARTPGGGTKQRRRRLGCSDERTAAASGMGPAAGLASRAIAARLPWPMLAYILRRLLLMIPTIFGIMLSRSRSCNSCPAARSSGRSRNCRARTRARRRVRRRRRPDRRRRGAGRRRHLLALSRRAGARSEIHQGAREAIRLRQAGARALLDPGRATIRPSISARAIIATCRCSS